MGELIFGIQNVRNYLNPSPNLRPSANAIPNMQVQVNEGKCWIGESLVTAYTTLTPTFTPPSSGLARIDVVGVSGPAGNLQVVTGTAATYPPPVPTMPSSNFYPVCLVLLYDTTAVLTDINLIDVRELADFGQAATWDHNTLTGRSNSDCHPESAITGLVADLSNRPTTSTMNAALATKADIGGTPSQQFDLNENVVGTPTLNGLFGVTRGTSPTVAIRWNESLDIWELTKDGTTYNQISTTVADSWVYWNLPTTTIAPTSNIIIGSMTVPTSSKVVSVRLGIRRTDDTNDSTIDARATQTGTPLNTVFTTTEGPVILTLPTALTAGQRLAFAAENTDVTSKTVVAMAGALIVQA